MPTLFTAYICCVNCFYQNFIQYTNPNVCKFRRIYLKRENSYTEWINENISISCHRTTMYARWRIINAKECLPMQIWYSLTLCKIHIYGWFLLFYFNFFHVCIHYSLTRSLTNKLCIILIKFMWFQFNFYTCKFSTFFLSSKHSFSSRFSRDNYGKQLKK